jgi:transcriptional regulator with XRE-family HTH domain
MTTESHNLEIDPHDQAWLQTQVQQMTFGRMLKAHRLAEDWTQEQASKRLGISKQAFNAYENERKLPSPKKAYEIAEKLGMVPEVAILAVLNDQLRQDHIPLQVQLVS